MAQIIRQVAVCDGYDVHFVIGSQPHALHFRKTPTADEITAAILEFEERLIAQTVADAQLESMPMEEPYSGL